MYLLLINYGSEGWSKEEFKTKQLLINRIKEGVYASFVVAKTIDLDINEELLEEAKHGKE